MRTHLLAPLVLALANASCMALGFEDPLGTKSSNTDQIRPGQPSYFPQQLVQKNLVSDQLNVAAFLDPNAINSWGLAFNPQGAAWVSNNGTGVASVYDAKGRTLATIAVPGCGESNSTSAPTGQVYNGDANAFRGDRFISVTEQGVIAGWQQGDDGSEVLRVDNSSSGAVYKGAAIARAGVSPRLFAADFHNARIDVFDADYKCVDNKEKAFVDPSLPSGFAPFNVYAANDLLLVAYAKQELPDKTDDEAGPGNGVISLFDGYGHFLERLITADVLNSPWAMAITPPAFGKIPNHLLIGNFGSGRIAVYNLAIDDLHLRASFEGFIGDAWNHVLEIDRLWALGFPPNTGGFDASDLYFTAGPKDEKHGLFGRLELPGN